MFNTIPIGTPVYSCGELIGQIYSLPFLANPNIPDDWYYIIQLGTFNQGYIQNDNNFHSFISKVIYHYSNLKYSPETKRVTC